MSILEHIASRLYEGKNHWFLFHLNHFCGGFFAFTESYSARNSIKNIKKLNEKKKQVAGF